MSRWKIGDWLCRSPLFSFKALENFCCFWSDSGRRALDGGSIIESVPVDRRRSSWRENGKIGHTSVIRLKTGWPADVLFFRTRGLISTSKLRSAPYSRWDARFVSLFPKYSKGVYRCRNCIYVPTGDRTGVVSLTIRICYKLQSMCWLGSRWRQWVPHTTVVKIQEAWQKCGLVNEWSTLMYIQLRRNNCQSVHIKGQR